MTTIEKIRRMIVYPGHDKYPGSGGLEVVPLLDAVSAVAQKA
jgi:hypothetical protein